MQKSGINTSKIVSVESCEFDSFLLNDPYTVPYEGIYVVCDENNEKAELIEHSKCFAGACWSHYHYGKSPLVTSSRILGETVRYMVNVGKKELILKSSTFAAGVGSLIVDSQNNEVEITYTGLGGGGIGATKCRASANGVIKSDISEAGGEMCALGKIYVPRRNRVLVAIDDTDSCEVGATWTLTHNIGQKVSCNDSILLSHSLVQLYPVPERTQNCMSTVLEFGCVSDSAKADLTYKIKKYLEKYSVSGNTGMAVYTGFDVPESLVDYGIKAGTLRLTKQDAIDVAIESGTEIILDGNGIIGAMGAISGFAKPTETVIPKFNF